MIEQAFFFCCVSGIAWCGLAYAITHFRPDWEPCLSGTTRAIVWVVPVMLLFFALDPADLLGGSQEQLLGQIADNLSYWSRQVIDPF